MEHAALERHLADLDEEGRLFVAHAVITGGKRVRADFAAGSQLSSFSHLLVEVLVAPLDLHEACKDCSEGGLEDEPFAELPPSARRTHAERFALVCLMRRLDTRFRDEIDAAVLQLSAAHRMPRARSFVRVSGRFCLPAGTLAEVGASLGLTCLFCRSCRPTEHPLCCWVRGASRGEEADPAEAIVRCCWHCFDRLAVARGGLRPAFAQRFPAIPFDAPAGSTRRALVNVLERPLGSSLLEREWFDPFFAFLGFRFEMVRQRALFNGGVRHCALSPATERHLLIAHDPLLAEAMLEFAVSKTRGHLEELLVEEAAADDTFLAAGFDCAAFSVGARLGPETAQQSGFELEELAKRNGASPQLAAAMQAAADARWAVHRTSLDDLVGVSRPTIQIVRNGLETAWRDACESRGASLEKDALRLSRLRELAEACAPHIDSIRELSLMTSVHSGPFLKARRHGGSALGNWLESGLGARSYSVPRQVRSVFASEFRVRVVETVFLHRRSDFSETLRKDRFEEIQGFCKFEVQRREGGTSAVLVARAPTSGLRKISDALHDLCQAGEAVREATKIGSVVNGRRVVDAALMAKIEELCDDSAAGAVRELQGMLGWMGDDGWHAEFGKDAFLAFLGCALPFHTAEALRDLARAAGNFPIAPVASGEFPKSTQCLLKRGRPLAESLVVL